MLKLHPSLPSLGLSHSGRQATQALLCVCISRDFKSATPFCFILNVQQVVHTSESVPSPSQSRNGSLHRPSFLLSESSSVLQVSVVLVVVLYLFFFHRNCIGMSCFTTTPNFKPQTPAGSIPWMQFP